MLNKSSGPQRWLGRVRMGAGEFLENCWVVKILININQWSAKMLLKALAHRGVGEGLERVLYNSFIKYQ